MKACYLSLVNFAGRGGRHTYATLHCGGQTREVTYVLTATAARDLNREEGGPWTYKAGSRCGRFDTEEEALETAVKEYRTHFPEAGVLIRGWLGRLDPSPVLHGPADFMTRANNVVAMCEAIDWWEKDEKGMEKLSKLWEELLKEFNIER